MTAELVLEGRGISRHPLTALGIPYERYRKSSPVRAGQVEIDGIVRTPEGDMRFFAGDYIVTDEPVTHAWPVARAIFEATHLLADIVASSDAVVFAVYAGDEDERFLVGHWADPAIASAVAARLQAIALERDPDRAPGRPAELSDGGLVLEVSERPLRAAMPTDEQLGATLDERGQWKASLDQLEVFDGPTCRVCGCTDMRACDGGCSWIDDPHDPEPVCSRCYALALAAV